MLEVLDQAQARLLTDPRSAAFIHPFLARERSTAEAAREAGCAINTMAYRIRVLAQAGLLTPSRIARRAGRAITYYRSSHDSYRVPLHSTAFTDQRDQARRVGAPIYRRLTDAYSHALAGAGSTTRLILRDDDDAVYATDLPPHRTPEQQPLLFEDRLIQLTTAQAEQLCATLERVLIDLTRDSGRPTETADHPKVTYTVMVAAVPL